MFCLINKVTGCIVVLFVFSIPENLKIFEL